MLEIGSIVGGKYKVLNIIGQGGMSTVYLVMNERANKQWAIKEVRKDAVADYQTVRQSLITETELLKELSHPFLPSIVDVIEEEGRFLIVMDYIEGNTLEKALKYMGAQPQDYVVEWGIQLCDVLEYLHTRKPPIIYRDLKPGNIMLKPNGTITLIDFGTAREYKCASAGDTSYLGTRGYAAPEQFGGKGQTDARTDIYCLGATMYHLVTGHDPSTPPYEFYPIRYWNEQLSPGLEYIINKCVQSNPDDRYSSCAEVMYDLQRYKELDRNYKKEAAGGIIMFALVAIICVLSGIFTFSFHGMAKSAEAEHYNTLISDAKGSVNSYEAQELYAMAIAEQPDNLEAYMELLDNLYLLDDNLSVEEDAYLRTILITPVKNGSTVQEALSKNKSSYAQVAYKLGITYFYCYDGVGNKNMASKWLQIALNTGELSQKQEERATRFNNICKYYNKLDNENTTGDEIDYQQYWNDLVATAEGNITETDNAVTALILYKHLALEVSNKANQFLGANVDYDIISEEIDFLLTRIEEDIECRSDNSQRVKDLVAETKMVCARAKAALENAKKG